MTDVPHRPDPYSAGRRDGLALGAFALALLSFVDLLGVEKAVLAAILAVLALKTAPGSRLVPWALGIAGLQVLTITAVLIIFHDELAELLKLLQQLS